MAKEPDQTRWVGIRPTDPAENIPVVEQAPLTSIQVEPKPGSADFPVTLGAEVPHVIVDSGGGAGIEPTEINTYAFNQVLTVNGTWYVSVDRADPGWLFYAAIYPGQTAINGFIGVTIDGGARMPIKVLPRADYVVQSFRCNLADAFGLEFYGLRFKVSIKIEYMLNAATTLKGTCLIGYD